MNSALANKPQIGPYKIIRAIGSGGMGEVYLASEERLGRNVALKVITPELANNASTLRRFETEGRTLAMINHKNVVSVYAIDYIDGFHFIAMEYIEGRSLSSLLRNLAFPANEAAALFTQLADGLAALHDKNVIHRDLKPHNIIFQKDSVVKIIDLGIAKSFNDTNISATTAGMMVGTIQYLAPEITLGRQATALSDIWSLGAIFYEMLTGSALIKATNFAQALGLVVNFKLEFPDDAAAAIPQEMQAIIRKMCARETEDRYKTARDIIRDLRAFSAKYPSAGKWTYPHCGREIKNAAAIRQNLLQKGHSEFALKRIIFMALQENDQMKALEVDPTKTQVIQLNNEEVLSEQSLNSAIRTLTRMSSVHQGQRLKKRATFWGSVVAAAAAVGFGVWIFLPQLMHSFTPPASPAKIATAPATPPALATPAQTPPVAQAAEPKAVAPEPEHAPAPGPPPPVKAAEEPAKVEPKATPEPAPVVREKIKPAPKPQFSSLTPNLINANLQSILKPAHPPQFTWSKLTGAAVYEIEIARDRDFGKTVLNEESKSESFTWAQAAPGKYFWHIRAKNTQGSISKYSEPGRIQLELAPVTLPPEIHATADEGHVQVSWPAMALASSYKVLVSRDAGFANVDQTQFAKKENAHLKISEAGTYFFKIAALDTSENEVSAFSNPAKLIVVNAVHMQAPTLMSPPPDANFPAGGGAMMFLLLWSKVETAESYDMEIANAADFKHILVKKEIKTNRLTLKQNLPKGQIYWRIRAKGKGAESPWSPTSRFEIQ